MPVIRNAITEVEEARVLRERFKGGSPSEPALAWSYRLDNAGFGRMRDGRENSALALRITAMIREQSGSLECDIRNAILCELVDPPAEVTPEILEAVVRGALLELAEHASLEHFAHVRTVLELVQVRPPSSAIRMFGEHMAELSRNVAIGAHSEGGPAPSP